jgi:predicted nucleic acid-binding Zn ribbon protein
MMIRKLLCNNKLLGYSSQVKRISAEIYLTCRGPAGNLVAEMKTKKDSAKFVHIGSVIEDVLKSYRREPDSELIQVWQIWNSIVGDVISKNAKPGAFKGRILLVYVSSSTWVHQLQFLKEEMIAKLNEALGKSLIDDLKFKIGPVK